MTKLTSLASGLLLLGSVLVALVALIEKISNMMGYTVVRMLMTPSRMLELTVVALLFAIVLQLRELKATMAGKG